MNPEVTFDSISHLFSQHGDSQYGGEAVTQLEHALQAALLAEQQGAPASLIAAALLHDVGHLLHHLPENAPDMGLDDLHEDLAAHWLAERFSPAVVEPVRLHVAAKRYLCAVEPAYHATLSAPSQLSLKLQGGPMSPEEVAEFDRLPYSADAVRLRHWDDAAKVSGLPTPPVEHFRQYFQQL